MTSEKSDDKAREVFERFAEAIGLPLPMNRAGSYLNNHTHYAWRGWCGRGGYDAALATKPDTQHSGELVDIAKELQKLAIAMNINGYVSNGATLQHLVGRLKAQIAPQPPKENA